MSCWKLVAIEMCANVFNEFLDFQVFVGLVWMMKNIDSIFAFTSTTHIHDLNLPWLQINIFWKLSVAPSTISTMLWHLF